MDHDILVYLSCSGYRRWQLGAALWLAAACLSDGIEFSGRNGGQWADGTDLHCDVPFLPQGAGGAAGVEYQTA